MQRTAAYIPDMLEEAGYVTGSPGEEEARSWQRGEMSLGEYLRLGIRDEWIAPAGEEDGYATLSEAWQDMQETIRALLPEDAGFEKLLYRTARDTGRPPEETSAWRSLSRESSPAGEASRSEAAAADGEAPQEEPLSAISPAAWDAVREGMRQMAADSDVLSRLSVETAGKTGTAQQDPSRPNHALFIGFGPYEAPEIAAATRIAYGYSSSNAVEVTADIFRYYFGLEPELAGRQLGGAARWLAVGSFRFQPSETAKLLLILFFSRWFAGARERGGSPFLLLQTAGLAAAPMLSILEEPDLSTTIVLGWILWRMFSSSGVDKKGFGAAFGGRKPAFWPFPLSRHQTRTDDFK